MLILRHNLLRRVTAALDASPSRIPVLLGGCGSGRTALLRQLRERIGRTAVQHVDVERTATTPERFLRAVTAVSPFPVSQPAEGGAAASGSARAAFDAALAFFSRARTSAGEPATFLLDEFLELRTFESFPGLRRVLHDCIDGLSASGNRFVLTSRYVARAMRLLRDRSARFEVIHMPALTVDETLNILGLTAPPPAAQASAPATTTPTFWRGRSSALADGRPAYVHAIADELASVREHGGGPAAATRSARSPRCSPPTAGSPSSAASATSCACTARAATARSRRFSKSSRDEEGLTLTEISQRLQRTPGSTKDYLSWLEDVDLVTARQKRYSFTDPLLRVWVRLHCRAVRAKRRRSGARSAPLRAAAPAAVRRAEAGAAGRAGVCDGRRTKLGNHRDRLNALGKRWPRRGRGNSADVLLCPGGADFGRRAS